MKKPVLIMPVLALVLLSARSGISTSEVISSNTNNSVSTQISSSTSIAPKLGNTSDTANVTPSPSSAPILLPSDNSISGAMHALKSVLFNEETLIYEDSMSDRLPIYNGYLKDIKYNDSPMETPQFAIIDLDGDNIPEVVLAIKDYNGFVILRYKNNKVTGNYINYRAFNQLTKDGSFISSSGSDYNSFGKIYFIGNTILTEDKYNSEGNSYFLRDVPIKKGTWDKQWISIVNSPKVDWFSYNKDEISQQFIRYSHSKNMSKSVKMLINERQKYLDSLSYLMDLTNHSAKSKKAENANAKNYYKGSNQQMKKIYKLCLKKSSGNELRALKKEQQQWKRSFNRILSTYLSDYHVKSINELKDQYLYTELGDMTLRRTINLVNRYFDYHFYD